MNNKLFSDAQEKKIASYLDWKQVTGSGARPTIPGDIESPEWLGECKTHTKPNQPIFFDSKVLDKIVSEASSKFKQAAYFADDGSQHVTKTWVIILDRDLSSRFSVKAYPYKVGATISFNNADLKKVTADNELYRLELGTYTVLLTTLETFSYII